MSTLLPPFLNPSGGMPTVPVQGTGQAQAAVAAEQPGAHHRGPWDELPSQGRGCDIGQTALLPGLLQGQDRFCDGDLHYYASNARCQQGITVKAPTGYRICSNQGPTWTPRR